WLVGAGSRFQHRARAGAALRGAEPRAPARDSDRRRAGGRQREAQRRRRLSQDGPSEAASAAASEVWSVRRVLAWAADALKKRGTDTGGLDVELLLGRVLGLDRIGLIMPSEKPLAPLELGRFRELFKRRRAGEPVAYLLGEREFFGMS